MNSPTLLYTGAFLLALLPALISADTVNHIASVGIANAAGAYLSSTFNVIGGSPMVDTSVVPVPALSTCSVETTDGTRLTGFPDSIDQCSSPTTSLPHLTGHVACALDTEAIIYGGLTYPTASAVPFIAGLIGASGGVYTPLNATLPAQASPNATGTAPTSRIEHTLTRFGNEALLLGGYDGTGLNGAGIRSVYRDFRSISPANPTGTVLPTPPQGWWQHTATLSAKGLLIVLGGMLEDGSLQPFDVANVYDPTAKAWSVKPLTGTPPSPRRDHAAINATVMGFPSILVHGGTDLPGTAYLADMFILNTDTWSWSPITPTNPIPGRHGHIITETALSIVLTFALGSIDPASTASDSPGLISHFNAPYASFFTSSSLNTNGSHLTTGVIVAIVVVACACFIALIIAYIIFRRRSNRRRARHNGKAPGNESWQWPTEMLSEHELTVHSENAARPAPSSPSPLSVAVAVPTPTPAAEKR